MVLERPAWFGIWGAGRRVHRPPQEWEETGEVQKRHPAGPSLGMTLVGGGVESALPTPQT